MEVDSPVNHHVAKRVWNMLRLAFFMCRKGGVVKRKMMLEMHLMMKRGKLLGKSLMESLVVHHRGRRSPRGYGLREYEFSFSSDSSAGPVGFLRKSKHHSYFPSIPGFSCIQPHPTEDSAEESFNHAIVLSHELDRNAELLSRKDLDADDLDGSCRRQSSVASSHRRSSAEDIEDQVDRKAEEFISKFYDQIRLQRQMSMVRYDEMLARGAM